MPTSGGHLHPLLKVSSPNAQFNPPTWPDLILEVAYYASQRGKWNAVCPTMGEHPGSCALQVRAQIRKIFTNMGFEEMPTNNYVESR